MFVPGAKDRFKRMVVGCGITKAYLSGKYKDDWDKNVYTETMNKIGYDEANKKYIYEAVLDLKSGGNYGYTFRAMPKHEMLVDQEDMNLIKWITK